MIAGPEAGDAAPSLNVNIEKEKVKYENQNERQGWCDQTPWPEQPG
jgi:hypothetical protein